MDSSRISLLLTLSTLLNLIPGLALDIMGLVFSIRARRRMRRAAKVGVIAFSGMLLLRIVGPVVDVLYNYVLIRILSYGFTFFLIRAIISLVMTLISACFMGVLIYGYFFPDRPSKE